MRHLRSIFSLLTFSLGSHAVAADVAVGHVHLAIPAGWSIADRSNERVTLRSDEGNQSITLSSQAFQAKISFDDFKRLCRLRLEAERKGAPGVFIEAGEPTASTVSYVFFFSGGDKVSRRIFSGQLKLVDNELMTTYLEGTNIDPKEHLAFFSKLVSSLKISGQSPNTSLERTRER